MKKLLQIIRKIVKLKIKNYIIQIYYADFIRKPF